MKKNKHSRTVAELLPEDQWIKTKDGKKIPVYRKKTYARPQGVIDVLEGKTEVRKVAF